MTDAELQLLIDRLDRDPSEAVLLRVVTALSSRGRMMEGRRRARSYLQREPGNLSVIAMLERLSAPAPGPGLRGRDPYYTAARAEAYARAGRNDLAARTYRRLLLDHAGDLGVLARLEQLGQEVRPRPQPRPLDPVGDWGEEVTVKMGFYR